MKLKLKKNIMYYKLLIIFVLGVSGSSCLNGAHAAMTAEENMIDIQPGAWQLSSYLPALKGKKVGMVVNHTSLIGNTHTVDSLLSLGVNIAKIFSPEHGFRGDADAGAHIDDQKDPATGISIVSLYGSKRKPGDTDLQGIDVLIFDIQDVGARFYTYISTLHLVMEACAENDKPLIVLDRPNPNAHYIDGPLMEDEFKSFVGMHNVPVVYGMTIGEYAQMINGEGWLENQVKCNLKVIACQDYRHDQIYHLPVPPSPNLPNLRSVLLYPSLCFFEGTPLSIGRGTNKQFQVIGHPTIQSGEYAFTPVSTFGAAKPKQQNQACHGVDLTTLSSAEIHAENQLNLSYIMDFYQDFPDKSSFFNKNGWFDRLAGTTKLREQIIAGKSEQEIRSSWSKDITNFKKIRSKYLLYP